MKVSLLVIDPQNDFCDPNGSLFVNGADKDMERLAKMIDRVGSKIDRINVTMDSHHLFDIAHPIFWTDENGNNPEPFTIITLDDVKNKEYSTKIPTLTKYGVDYVESLDKNGRYPLCIWPPHCLIGSKGQTIVNTLYDSLTKWEENGPRMVNYVTKGSNYLTEHYSAIKADVPDPKDYTTQLNSNLIDSLLETDIIAIAGEAGSHCLANTVRDIVDTFTDSNLIEKFILLTDATSPVTGFEKMQEDFISEMINKGMKTQKTEEFLV